MKRLNFSQRNILPYKCSCEDIIPRLPWFSLENACREEELKILKKKVSPGLLPVEYAGGISFDSLVLNKR